MFWGHLKVWNFGFQKIQSHTKFWRKLKDSTNKSCGNLMELPIVYDFIANFLSFHLVNIFSWVRKKKESLRGNFLRRRAIGAGSNFFWVQYVLIYWQWQFSPRLLSKISTNWTKLELTLFVNYLSFKFCSELCKWYCGVFSLEISLTNSYNTFNLMYMSFRQDLFMNQVTFKIVKTKSCWVPKKRLRLVIVFLL